MTLRVEGVGDMRKCNTPGCPVHVYPGRLCGDCGQPTIDLKQWRADVDAVPPLAGEPARPR